MILTLAKAVRKMLQKRFCSLLVFLGIEYCYLLMRKWRPTVELNMYQKTEKHTHSLFFNCIALKENF